MHRYEEWAEKEYRIQHRLGATALAGVLVVIFIPLITLKISNMVETRFAIRGFDLGLINHLPGGLLILAGFGQALWPIIAQLDRGRGTPLPMMATQELLISGPFKLCRNPMTLGTLLLYLGLGVYSGSVTALALFGFLLGLLLLYLRMVEERELENRFGEAYLAYKREVPFLIPRFGGRD